LETPLIRVAVAGALGKMGQATLKALLEEEKAYAAGQAQVGATPVKLVAALNRSGLGQDAAHVVGYPPCGVTITADWANALPHADVCVEFTQPDGVFERTMAIIAAGVRPVIGTTGLTTEELSTIDSALTAKGLGGLVVPNFSIGAVLLMQMAAQAAKYFAHAEIIEIHHNRKADAPSGTAIKTAQLMVANRPAGFGQDNAPEVELMPGARGATGAGDIHIHSVRLPGMVAHQEVILTSPGQLLTLRHDSFDRACYMPGVLLAIRHAMASTGLTYGLENLL
jgi:4-hydroxy-tetrahydrodipicolinate reductase